MEDEETKKAASLLGKKGGQSKSDAKKKASRENKRKALADGKNKGGRPKKQHVEPKTSA